ncbi:MAG: leucine-rich repeat domain-containing protein [Sedimentisphaerales bacterium]|nr:leucine-rich repeat domain-containing protein [Sedimentisphaerales bacterium]
MADKANRLKIIIGIGALLLIIAGLLVSFLKWEPKPDPTSEKIIREIAGKQLNKDPNSLTDEDFAQITNISINSKKFSDIKLLEKLTNLERLELFDIHYPMGAIPKWMSFLAKHGLLNLEKRFAIDLSPLTNLDNLQSLNISSTQVADITPLANLKKLNILNLGDTQVSDIKPLANLKNLQELNLGNTQVSDISVLAKLTNLRILYIMGTKVRDISVLTNLTKLQLLEISKTDISDIKPLANLKNLKTLALFGTNVSDEQEAELKKALPYLRIMH